MKQAIATVERVDTQVLVNKVSSTQFRKPRVIFDDGNEYIHIVLRAKLIDGEERFQILIIEGARDPLSKRRTKEEVLEEFETERAAVWYLEACVQDLE